MFTIRIAVASSDGKVVNEHFGRARQFLIFEVTGDDYGFLERRQNVPPCTGSEHHEKRLDATLRLISDCTAVLVSMVGPVAAQELENRSIQVFVVPGFIPESLARVIDWLKASQIQQQGAYSDGKGES